MSDGSEGRPEGSRDGDRSGEEAAGASLQSRAADRRSDDARDEAVEARDQAKQARDDAERARDRAEDARDKAEDARDDAEGSRGRTGTPTGRDTTGQDSLAEPHELLIHPDDEPDEDSDQPFGQPGNPLSRHSAFYVGFTGTLGVLLALFVGMAIRDARSVLILIIVSIFLAVGLNPIVEWLMHRGIKRRWSVLIVTLGVLGFLTLFVVSLVPVVRDQIEALIDNVPGWLEDLRTNRRVQDLDDKYDVIDKANEKLRDPDLAETAFGSVFTVGLAVLGALWNAFLIFVLTIYLLSSLPQIKRAAYGLAPASRRQRVTYLGDEVLRSVGGYVAGAFVIASCAGVTSFIFLEIVGLAEYAVALALVVAILDLIPLVGATIGAAIVSLVGFATDPKIGLACVIFYVVYQQLENYVLYPRVMRSSVDVPGVVTVIAVLIGGTLLGVVGALLAIPTAAAVLLIVREVYQRRQDAT
jgi:predicted PurR-regulated permease PerM